MFTECITSRVFVGIEVYELFDGWLGYVGLCVGL